MHVCTRRARASRPAAFQCWVVDQSAVLRNKSGRWDHCHGAETADL